MLFLEEEIDEVVSRLDGDERVVVWLVGDFLAFDEVVDDGSAGEGGELGDCDGVGVAVGLLAGWVGVYYLDYHYQIWKDK